MSGWFDSFNQAVGFTEDPAENQRKAQEQSLAWQKDIYNQQREDFKPYQEMGAQGVKNYNNFTANPEAYLSTPAYQWQKTQIDKDMNRQLSARGRSNSTFGMNALSNAYGNLASKEYNAAYDRMLDPIKIGQGMAGTAGAGANTMMGAYGSYGANMGNAAQQAYANKQNSLYGAAGMGLSAYNTFRNKGGGGGGFGNGYGDLYNDAGGDINNVNFGDDWGSWSDGTAA